MKKITILVIIAAVFCSCTTTKNAVAKNAVAKNELVEVINVFNNDVAEDYIDSVSVYSLDGRRIIKLHAEQADELVMQEAGIYVIYMESANGLVFSRKCLNKGDGWLMLSSPIVIKQEFPKYDVDWYKRERNKIQ